MKRINTILIDLRQDIWLYISYEYLSLSINKNEVGSSTMPQAKLILLILKMRKVTY